MFGYKIIFRGHSAGFQIFKNTTCAKYLNLGVSHNKLDRESAIDESGFDSWQEKFIVQSAKVFTYTYLDYLRTGLQPWTNVTKT